MKNGKYTLEELLKDESFIKSITNPDTASSVYWQEAVKQGILDEETLEEARKVALFINKNNPPDSLIDSRILVIWDRIEESIQSNRRKLYKYVSIAAAVVIIATLGINYFINNDLSKTSPLLVQNMQNADIKANKIQLITADEKMTISGDVAEINYSQEEIIVNNEVIGKKAGEKGKLKYDQLIVPYGKRSLLILSDGSKIWVNAGTRVIYPVEFSKNKREISIDGEIYGDFVRDTSRPFTIKARDMEVQILGTQLNIQTYWDDSFQTVVLVTGAVNVKKKGSKAQRLMPNQMITITKDDINVRTVNVLNYTSWKDGCYQFRNEKLETVLSRLSKYYGVKIECDPKAANLQCSGGLFYQNSIHQILDGVCLSAPVKYEMKGDKYIFSTNP